MACVGYSYPFHPPHSAVLITPLLTQINTARTQIKCYLQPVLLAPQRDKATWEQRSFCSSLKLLTSDEM